MGHIQIDLERADDSGHEQLRKLGESAVEAECDEFEGGADLVTWAVELTAVSVPILGLLIRERIRSRRFIRVKLKGVEVTGAELRDVDKLLRRLSDEDQ